MCVQSQTDSSTVHSFLPALFIEYPNVRDLAISPFEDELYFSLQGYQGELSSIICLKKDTNGIWKKADVADFSGMYQDLEPAFSPDGLRLYFVSNRPNNKKTTEPKDYDIWYISRKDRNSTWSEPINIGAPINTVNNEFYPSITNSNNLYFTSDAGNTKGKDDIFISKWINGKYTTPESLSDSINSAGYEFNAFVAPDESYLIYTCYNRPFGSGSGDLYISYRNKNGDWSNAQNMGKEINSAQMDYCPFVDLKGNLYFTSKRNNLVTQFDGKKTISEILEEMNKYENGLSRLYQVKLPK